jgi:putative nucleotidyltransferase with HDIG domain
MGPNKERNGLGAVHALAARVGTQDPYTQDHSRRVKIYAMALAEATGLSPDQVDIVNTAALLHDIGKIGMPDEVLLKEGELNDEDWKAIKTHPQLGATIIKNVPNLAPCVNIVLYHHERWDGDGYPEGLKGEEIPIEARIIAIAESFDYMISALLYRPALSLEETIKELREGAGSQFDPKLVDTLIGIIQDGLPRKGWQRLMNMRSVKGTNDT